MRSKEWVFYIYLNLRETNDGFDEQPPRLLLSPNNYTFRFHEEAIIPRGGMITSVLTSSKQLRRHVVFLSHCNPGGLRFPRSAADSFPEMKTNRDVTNLLFVSE